MYCVKCKRKTDTLNKGSRITKNNRKMSTGTCAVCGSKKTQFVGSGLVNDFVNNLPFEMHMPGHNFLGPGTNLNKRLNKDLTPKSWSMPVDRDDEAAYRHDLCYARHKDTKTRNEVCDKRMLQDLTNILNPTKAERRHIGITKALIGTKKRFGMGIKKKFGQMS